MKKKDLAIILPVLNCLPYSKQMIPTIKTLRPYNLILINNGSVDGTKKYFNQLAKADNVDAVHFEKNKGCSASWNFGIRRAITKFDSRYFFIPNNDILLHPKCIDVLFEAIRSKSVALTTAMDISGSISASIEILGLGLPIKTVYVEKPEFSCFMIKKETIDKVGYFDEKFFPAYFEDNDYHYRINLAGMRAIKINRALYFHYGSRTIKNDDRIKAVSDHGYLANRDYYKKKWGGVPGQEVYTTPFGQ